MSKPLDPAYIITHLKDVKSRAARAKEQYGLYPQESIDDVLTIVGEVINLLTYHDLVADAMLLRVLRDACGFVEDGSSTSIEISQDDATGDWAIRITPNTLFHASSFVGVIKAVQSWLVKRNNAENV